MAKAASGLPNRRACQSGPQAALDIRQIIISLVDAAAMGSLVAGRGLSSDNSRMRLRL